jgi:hypothetical protein
VLNTRVGIAPQVVGVHPDPHGCPPTPEPSELASVPLQATRQLELEVTNAARKVALEEQGEDPAFTIADDRGVAERSVQVWVPEQSLHGHALLTCERVEQGEFQGAEGGRVGIDALPVGRHP